MKRALLTQMKNEWASNLWLVIELLVVSVVVGYLCWMLGRNLLVYNMPQPFDRNDVYVGNIGRVDEQSEMFVDMGEETHSRNAEDLETLANRLRDLDCVEEVSFSSNGLPYNYNFTGNSFMDREAGDSIHMGANFRYVSPEYPKVMRLKALSGSTPEQLSETLARGEILLAPSEFYQDGNPKSDKPVRHDPLAMKGHTMVNGGELEYVVGDVIPVIRRSDLEHMPNSGTAVIPLTDRNKVYGWCSEVEVRVRPGQGAEFMEAVYNDESLRELRNISFLNFQSLDEVRMVCQETGMRSIRMSIAQIVLLLFIVFLGLLGTFWFRVQERRGEIALRKVCGATSVQIARRLFGEGMLLMSLALVLAVGLSTWLFFHFKDMVDTWLLSRGATLTMVLSLGAAVLVMYLMVAIGIWFPMRRAVRVEPAVALKQE